MVCGMGGGLHAACCTLRRGGWGTGAVMGVGLQHSHLRKVSRQQDLITDVTQLQPATSKR